MHNIVYENGAAHIIREGEGHYTVWQRNGTASYKKGTYHFSDRPDYALQRAKTRADELREEPGPFVKRLI